MDFYCSNIKFVFWPSIYLQSWPTYKALQISERFNFNSMTPGNSQPYSDNDNRSVGHKSNNSGVLANAKNFVT
jgi:hypothetical protein